MESYELKEMIDTLEIKKVSFDEYEFVFEFRNGVSVTVGKTTEWDCAAWEIESSIEKEQARIRWEEQDKRNKENNRLQKIKEDAILSKFPPEQWEEIRRTFRR